MSLSTNWGMSALMGSQPCLKKGMLMMTMTQNEHDSTVQCPVCVHRPRCCAVLKNVTTYPLPPTHTFLKWPFLAGLKKIHIPPLCGDMFAQGRKTCKKNPKKCQNAQSWHIMNCPREILPIALKCPKFTSEVVGLRLSLICIY